MTPGRDDSEGEADGDLAGRHGAVIFAERECERQQAEDAGDGLNGLHVPCDPVSALHEDFTMDAFEPSCFRINVTSAAAQR